MHSRGQKKWPTKGDYTPPNEQLMADGWGIIHKEFGVICYLLIHTNYTPPNLVGG